MSKKIVGICACPVGIAHTYMAAEALVLAGKKHGVEVIIETQGGAGIENTLNKKDIDESVCVILTNDVSIKGEERFKGKKVSLMTIMLIQTIPTFVGITAYFTMYSIISDITPVFTRQMMLVLIYTGGGIASNTFILKGYLDSISTELDDAAKIDGCSGMQIYRLIIMPIAKPMLAITALWSFIGPFMDFLLPKVLLTTPADYTLAAGLFTLVNDVRNMNEPAFAAGGLLTAIPIVILFLVLQKQLVAGLSNGATKG